MAKTGQGAQGSQKKKKICYTRRSKVQNLGIEPVNIHKVYTR